MDKMKILVPVDFSETSERAFAEALRLAGRLDAELELVHVIPPSPSAGAPAVAGAVATQGELLASAEAELARLGKRAVEQGCSVRTHLSLEPVVPCLIELIDQRQPALVIVGSHGRGGVVRALLGSVSDALCRRSSVPVLVVPSPKRQQLLIGPAAS